MSFSSSSSTVSSSDSDSEIITYITRQRRRTNIRVDQMLLEESDFLCRFRISRTTAQYLCQCIEAEIQSNTPRNNALSVSDQLLVTLRFYATCSMQQVVGDINKMHKSSICRAIHRVPRAIAALAPNYIYMPRNSDEISAVTNDFYRIANFPRVIGAIDCTHVPIQSPGTDQAELYRCRKDFFSLNVQTVVDAKLRIMDIVCRWPGSVHDSTIFDNSRIKERMENGEFGNRLARAREDLQQAGSVRAAAKQESRRRASAMSIYCSQIGDTRPISGCRFSSDSQMLITSSWSGLVKLWSVPGCEPLLTLKGHTCNVSSATFSPKAVTPQSFTDKIKAVEQSKECQESLDQLQVAMETSDDSHVCAMASCAYDGSVYLWSFGSDGPIASLEGHKPHRVCRTEFHPSGRFLATAVFDNSWRLWDLETATEVLHQEGHAKEVYSLAFQGDGSLIATGGMDAFGRVWDLRTGRCVMFLEGHLGAVLGTHWAPDACHLATAAADHQAKIWDIRKRSILYTIPAHTHLVSDVRFQQSHGHYLITSSYDKTTKIWSNPAWHPLRTLSGHDNKVMSADISPDSRYVATSSYDRTFKLWAPDLA